MSMSRGGIFYMTVAGAELEKGRHLYQWPSCTGEVQY
jgi:hypothetical protein